MEAKSQTNQFHADASAGVDATAFWSVGAPGQGSPQPSQSHLAPQQPQYEFNSMPEYTNIRSTTARQASKMNLLVGALVVIAGAFFLFQFLTYGHGPFEALTKIGSSDFTHQEIDSQLVNVPTVAAKQTPPMSAQVEVKAQNLTESPVIVASDPVLVKFAGETFENPYKGLLNPSIQSSFKLGKHIGTELENAYRMQLESPDYYVRYKAVSDIVAARQSGVEELLKVAISSGQFWMRMHALIGLADFGYAIDTVLVAQALGEAHSELRARFFERFGSSRACDVGCMFVVREAMKILDARGRREALRVVLLDASPVTLDFAVAASFDQDERVRKMAQTFLLQNPIEETRWHELYQVIASGSQPEKIVAEVKSPWENAPKVNLKKVPLPLPPLEEVSLLDTLITDLGEDVLLYGAIAILALILLATQLWKKSQQAKAPTQVVVQVGQFGAGNGQQISGYSAPVIPANSQPVFVQVSGAAAQQPEMPKMPVLTL
jgi:hypothetical protein